MTNIISIWLMLIGTTENAVKLRQRVDGLKPPRLDPLFGPEPNQCPLTVLYGAEASRAAYVNSVLRPALDAWDQGYIDAGDIRRYCLEIEAGRYKGPIYRGEYSSHPDALAYYDGPR